MIFTYHQMSRLLVSFPIYYYFIKQRSQVCQIYHHYFVCTDQKIISTVLVYCLPPGIPQRRPSRVVTLCPAAGYTQPVLQSFQVPKSSMISKGAIGLSLNYRVTTCLVIVTDILAHRQMPSDIKTCHDNGFVFRITSCC